jgi:hypothetical protein
MCNNAALAGAATFWSIAPDSAPEPMIVPARTLRVLAAIAAALSERPAQSHPHRVLVRVIVDQTLSIAQKHVGIAFDVPRQRECPAELMAPRSVEKLRRNKAE